MFLRLSAFNCIWSGCSLIPAGDYFFFCNSADVYYGRLNALALFAAWLCFDATGESAHRHYPFAAQAEASLGPEKFFFFGGRVYSDDFIFRTELQIHTKYLLFLLSLPLKWNHVLKLTKHIETIYNFVEVRLPFGS